MEKLNEKQLRAFRFIRNCLVHAGKSPSVRDVMKELEYSSPNSAVFVIESLIKIGLLQRRKDKKLQLARDLILDQKDERTVEVPLVGLVPCGTAVMSEENIEARIPVSEKLARPPHKYFLLRASGDSMDLAGINDGDLVLVRQQPTAENGENVVALIDGESTIKEFRRERDVVLLKPMSTKSEHKTIIVTSDFLVQGVVVASISGDL